MTYVVFAVAIVVAYLLGSVPFAFLIARAYGKDLRTIGSGNIGATNLARALGRKWGYLCFALDVLKGFIPVVAVRSHRGHAGGARPAGPVAGRRHRGDSRARLFGVPRIQRRQRRRHQLRRRPGPVALFHHLRADRPGRLGGHRPGLAVRLAGLDLCGGELSRRPVRRRPGRSELDASPVSGRC